MLGLASLGRRQIETPARNLCSSVTAPPPQKPIGTRRVSVRDARVDCGGTVAEACVKFDDEANANVPFVTSYQWGLLRDTSERDPPRCWRKLIFSEGLCAQLGMTFAPAK
jgi:hypothetical protein